MNQIPITQKTESEISEKVSQDTENLNYRYSIYIHIYLHGSTSN